MRLLISISLALWLTAGPHPGLGLVQAAGILRQHHPWGRFNAGAWTRIREVKEELNEKGLVTLTSVTHRWTALAGVDQDGLTLRRDEVYDVSGKQWSRAPETLKDGFHGEPLSQALKIKEARDGHVVIEGRKIPCKMLQLESTGPASKTLTTIYYSATVAPYILKRQSVTTDLQGNNSRNEKTVDVVALDMPYKFVAEILNTAHVKTVLKHPKGTKTTFAVTSTDVPGGVVWYASKELDNSGRLVRRSLLELADYGLEPEPERTRIFSLRRRGIFGRTLPPRQP